MVVTINAKRKQHGETRTNMKEKGSQRRKCNRLVSDAGTSTHLVTVLKLIKADDLRSLEAYDPSIKKVASHLHTCMLACNTVCFVWGIKTR